MSEQEVAMPARDRMPDTIKRSSQKAQRTWAKAYDSATEQYGHGERANRTAYSALKHGFERKGDRWVAKDRKGPSDPRARQSGERARRGHGETFGGVDVEGNTKEELYRRAKDLGVEGPLEDVEARAREGHHAQAVGDLGRPPLNRHARE